MYASSLPSIETAYLERPFKNTWEGNSLDHPHHKMYHVLSRIGQSYLSTPILREVVRKFTNIRSNVADEISILAAGALAD